MCSQCAEVLASLAAQADKRLWATGANNIHDITHAGVFEQILTKVEPLLVDATPTTTERLALADDLLEFELFEMALSTAATAFYRGMSQEKGEALRRMLTRPPLVADLATLLRVIGEEVLTSVEQTPQADGSRPSDPE